MTVTDARPAPRVSVVLPVYNARKTLPRAIESVQAQTLADWELVAVDDGSTDGSAEWLAAQARVDSRIRPILRPHEGLVATLNTGLAAARSEWVARLDADDFCTPDRLAMQLGFAAVHPDLGVIGSRVEYAGENEIQPGYAAYVDWLNSLEHPEAIENGRFIESPFAHPCVMFRRGLVARHGGYRAGDFPEDYELWLRWLEAGVRMAKVPQPLLRWYDSPGRLSRTDPRYAPAAFFRLKAGFLARWLKTYIRNPDRRILVWGAGRLTRRRVEFLEAEGTQVAGFVDIDPNKHGRRRDGRSVIGPEALPGAAEVFVLGYVATRGAREFQRGHLTGRGFVEGRDFLFAA